MPAYHRLLEMDKPMSHEKDSPKPAETETAGTTRRDFLKTAALGVGGTIIAMGAPGFAAAPAMGVMVPKAKAKVLKSAGLKPRVPMATGRVLGANDRIPPHMMRSFSIGCCGLGVESSGVGNVRNLR